MVRTHPSVSDEGVEHPNPEGLRWIAVAANVTKGEIPRGVDRACEWGVGDDHEIGIGDIVIEMIDRFRPFDRHEFQTNIFDNKSVCPNAATPGQRNSISGTQFPPKLSDISESVTENRL